MIQNSRKTRSTWIVWGIAGFVLLFVAWASFMEIEQRAQATGQLIASSRTQIVQSSLDGVLSDLKVSEGQLVKKGQLLGVLEQDQARAAYDESSGKVAALRAAMLRYEAEVTGSVLAFPRQLVKNYPEFVQNQTVLYMRRQRSLEEEVGTLKSLLANTQEELRVSEPLLKTGDISKVEILRLKKQIAEIEGQIVNRRNKFYQDAQAELTKAQEDLAAQTQALNDRTVNLGRTEIRSPADGTVRNIRITTRGARVRPGDVVMEITPTDNDPVFEAKLKPVDIGFVSEGLPATIKLDAWDYSIYGVLTGRVIYISQDALAEDTRQGEQIYYRVRVRVNPDSRIKDRQGQLVDLQAGMTGQVEIRTGGQTVLSYLTKPITKTLHQSFHER